MLTGKNSESGRCKDQPPVSGISTVTKSPNIFHQKKKKKWSWLESLEEVVSGSIGSKDRIYFLALGNIRLYSLCARHICTQTKQYLSTVLTGTGKHLYQSNALHKNQFPSESGKLMIQIIPLIIFFSIMYFLLEKLKYSAWKIQQSKIFFKGIIYLKKNLCYFNVRIYDKIYGLHKSHKAFQRSLFLASWHHSWNSVCK